MAVLVLVDILKVVLIYLEEVVFLYGFSSYFDFTTLGFVDVQKLFQNRVGHK